MEDIFEQTKALDSLTEKQREVLTLVAEGMTSKEIARKIGISESAVNQRIEVIRQRLGGLPRTQIARLYRRMSTVVFTVPSSNPVTGKSIQLLIDGAEAQASEPEGSEVSTVPLQVTSRVGSHPSNIDFASAFDGPSGRWLRFAIVVGAIFALAATTALTVDIILGVKHLLHGGE